MIEKETILKIAHLARLEFSDAEIGNLQEQVGRVLEYVERIQQAPTEGVEPTAHVMDVRLVLRGDVPAQGETAAGRYLEGAPESGYGFFKVPRIVEGGEHGSV